MEHPDDAVGVPDSTYVVRRIHPNQYVPDSAGGLRASRSAFRDDEMSVGLTVILDEMHQPVERAVEGYEIHGLVRFPVSWIRHVLKLGTVRSPTTAEPWHGDVHGKKTKAIQGEFVKNATDWVKEPKVVEHQDRRPPDAPTRSDE